MPEEDDIDGSLFLTRTENPIITKTRRCRSLRLLPRIPKGEKPFGGVRGRALRNGVRCGAPRLVLLSVLMVFIISTAIVLLAGRG